MQVSAVAIAQCPEPLRALARPTKETSGRRVMNHSIVTADRNTHVKMVVVALVAAIMVVTVGIAAHLRTSGVELAGVMPDRTVKVGVVKPAATMNWTAHDGVAVR
jgi:hypothetical protein